MKYLIFDADFTLLDFEEDERRAIRAAFLACGKCATPLEVQNTRAFSDEDWAKRGLWSVTESAVQSDYHARYEEHLTAVTEYISLVTKSKTPLNEVKGVFDEALFAPSFLLPEAEETVKTLSARYRVCVATNGLMRMQQGRLSRLAPYLYRIFVSEELKCIKPQKEFFLRILQALHASPADCAMVGDSLEADIIGAREAGIPCFWVDGSEEPAPNGVIKLRSLKEILRFL